MSKFISEGDRSSPEVVRMIRRHEQVAKECMALMQKRYRKQGDQMMVEAFLNTIGIMAAEQIRMGAMVFGKDGADAFHALFQKHIDKARVEVLEEDSA